LGVLNLHKISVYCRISPPSSVCTIFVVVPAASANVNCQFVIYIYGAVRRYIQVSGFKTIRPWKSQATPCSTPFVYWRAGRSHSRSALLVHSTAATTAAAPCSPVQRLGPISLTFSDAFHGRSQQPYTNSHCWEEHGNNLLTAQLIVKGIGSKYLNIQNTATPFGTRLLPSRD